MDLSKLIQSIETAPLPFENWHPKFCGDIDMMIKQNGDWYFNGSLITRPAMVKLFAKVLIFENGEYFLKTPVEKMRISVEDTPFIIVQWHSIEQNKQDVIICQDNVGNEFVLSQKHNLVVRNEIPNLVLNHGLEAKVSRNVYYQWAAQAKEQEGRFFIMSGGLRHYLN